ncbi:MAG TPA: methionyl-tRNA formyltransferase, partial [Caulobacteraceae bacterium]
SLADRLAPIGASLLPRALAALERGGAVETPQAGEPTYARKITAAEARLDWRRPAADIDRQVRGLSPFPGAWFEAPSERGPVRVKALLSQVHGASGAPGQVLDVPGLVVGTGAGAVALTRLQREGGRAQDAEEFRRGFALPAGTSLV